MPGFQNGNSHHNIAEEDENTPISLAGLEARDNLTWKLGYIKRHYDKKMNELDHEQSTVDQTLLELRNDLHRSLQDTSGTAEDFQTRIAEQELIAEQIAMWKERLETVKQNQNDLINEATRLFNASRSRNEASLEHVESFLMPDMVRSIMALSSD